ncbi:hypothetical protein CWM57_12285 [Klebsiella sp. G-Nf4]|nr:hypothetical protein CWM64_12375 [Klebsiella sp. I-Nf8]PJX69728.1 hypothetical protein CWM57_12285 [Klebsiella sp. G-Nf4]PJX76165.1 hypothetical protein CWM55_05920 [Klebsiella sp. G2-16S-Nf13]PKJ76241.1 hypothetical protein CWM65_01175 [Klebsiella sp. J-Nf11]
MPGGGSRLARPTFVRPAVNLFTFLAETAVAGRSPGVQGVAATGRPLCAPCAMRGITQKTCRERHLPGHNTEQPFFRGEIIANR